MGKSRSATCVMAYLMHKHHITPHEALAQCREARPLCEPNDGFMKQLEIYHAMGAPADGIDESPAYQRWAYLREVELSRACGTAPEADKIRFEDEHVQQQHQNQQNQPAAHLELRCRKCRYAPSLSFTLPVANCKSGPYIPTPPLATPLLQIANGPSVPCASCRQPWPDRCSSPLRLARAHHP